MNSFIKKLKYYANIIDINRLKNHETNQHNHPPFSGNKIPVKKKKTVLSVFFTPITPYRNCTNNAEVSMFALKENENIKLSQIDNGLIPSMYGP